MKTKKQRIDRFAVLRIKENLHDKVVKYQGDYFLGCLYHVIPAVWAYFFKRISDTVMTQHPSREMELQKALFVEFQLEMHQ